MWQDDEARMAEVRKLVEQIVSAFDRLVNVIEVEAARTRIMVRELAGLSRV